MDGSALWVHLEYRVCQEIAGLKQPDDFLIGETTLRPVFIEPSTIPRG
jgi:hypothetical protein